MAGIKLKPCPFCGGKASIWGKDYNIKVAGCNNIFGCGAEGGMACTEREAADKWNRRVTDGKT